MYGKGRTYFLDNKLEAEEYFINGKLNGIVKSYSP